MSNPRLKLKRRDLALVLRCIACNHGITVPVDDVLINGEMPRCLFCGGMVYVETAKERGR